MDIGDVLKQVRERIDEADVERSGDISGDINAVTAVNVGQSDTVNGASAIQDVEIIQNGRRTRLHRER